MNRDDRIGLTQISRELGVTRKIAAKMLRKVRWVCPPLGKPPKWDPRTVDLIRAMQGKPHRQLEPAHNDWLSRYLKGTA